MRFLLLRINLFFHLVYYFSDQDSVRPQITSYVQIVASLKQAYVNTVKPLEGPTHFEQFHRYLAHFDYFDSTYFCFQYSPPIRDSEIERKPSILFLGEQGVGKVLPFILFFNIIFYSPFSQTTFIEKLVGRQYPLLPNPFVR